MICCMPYECLLLLGEEHQATGTSTCIPNEEDCIPSEHSGETVHCLPEKEIRTNEVDYIFFGNSDDEEN